jgi:hypothetical protein
MFQKAYELNDLPEPERFADAEIFDPMAAKAQAQAMGGIMNQVSGMAMEGLGQEGGGVPGTGENTPAPDNVGPVSQDGTEMRSQIQQGVGGDTQMNIPPIGATRGMA